MPYYVVDNGSVHCHPTPSHHDPVCHPNSFEESFQLLSLVCHPNSFAESFQLLSLSERYEVLGNGVIALDLRPLPSNVRSITFTFFSAC